MTFKAGDWVRVKDEHDIPAILRPDGQPTKGLVAAVWGEGIEIWVPIDGADVDEHSQAVVYEPHMLEAIDG